MKLLKGLVLIFFLVPATAKAHEGVTYPMIIDKEIGTTPISNVSIIADPDLGAGTLTYFFKGSLDLNTLSIDVISSPYDKTKPELTARAHFDSRKKNFVAEIPFSQEGRWTIRTVLTQNQQIVADWEEMLDVVREGPSRMEFVLYTIPFLLVGLLLAKVYLSKKRFKS